MKATWKTVFLIATILLMLLVAVVGCEHKKSTKQDQSQQSGTTQKQTEKATEKATEKSS